jgi:tRNA nucleotidyltransferase (CCA-adding enzyme)
METTMKIYLVGGAVRDKVMGLEPKDKDYVVVGATYQDMIEIGFKPIEAQSFPVFHHPVTGDEYALARKERKTGPGYHGFECICDPTVTLREDLMRRDLTINGMAQDVHTSEIFDYFNGIEDLKNKVLRHTSEAFAEDPVRVLRLARFAARYGFSIHRDTQILVHDMVTDGELENLTTERIWLEIEKAMTEEKPSVFFQTLYSFRLEHIYNEIFRPFSTVIDIGYGLPLVQRFMLFALPPVFKIEELVEMFRVLKAPNEIITGLYRFGKLLPELRNWENSAHQIYDIIEMYNGFKDPDYMHNFGKVVNAILTHALTLPQEGAANNILAWNMRLMTIHEMCLKAGKINFDSLTKEQQTTLKGPAVGAAIKDVRIKLIESCINI